MSKLAPVTTGQPTQGIGAAPTAAPATTPATDSPVRATPRRAVSVASAPSPAPARPYASPLEAQRAEAEAAGVLLADPEEGEDSSLVAASLPPAGLSSRDPYSNIRHTAAAAWLTLEAKEIEVRKYFREIPRPTGHELLAKMRRQCDLAAETLQQRIDEGLTERCTGCGKTLEEARRSMWTLQGSDADPDTGVPVPYFFCNQLCIRDRNRRKHLPPELRDQKRFDGDDMGDIR